MPDQCPCIRMSSALGSLHEAPFFETKKKLPGSFSFVHVPGIPGALEKPLIDRLHHSHNTTFSNSEGKRPAQSADQHV